MSKEVDRQKVFQTTKVRTSLKNDLSWIQKSKAKEESSIASKDNTSPLKGSSYVLITAKKFESAGSPTNEEPTPFSEPTTPTDNGSQNGNIEKHTSEPASPEQSNDQQTTATSTTEVKNDLEPSKSNEEAAAEVSTSTEVKDVSETSAEKVTGQNNDVSEVTAEPKVNGSSPDIETGGELAVQPEIVTCEEDAKIVEASVDAPVENETIILTDTKEEDAAVQGSVVPDILAESVYKSPSVLESQVKENGCSKGKAIDILYDSLVGPIQNIESKEANSGHSMLVDQSATEDAIIVTVLKVETTDEDTDVTNDVEPAIANNVELDIRESQSTEQKQSTKEVTAEVEITKTVEIDDQNSATQNVEETAQDTTEATQSEIKEEVSVDQTATEEGKIEDVPDPTSTTEATESELQIEANSSEPAEVETVVASSEVATVSDVVPEKAKTIEASEPVANLVAKTEKVTAETVEEKTAVEPTQAEVKSEATSEQVPNIVPESSEQPIEKVEVSNETEVQSSVKTPAAAIEENVTKSAETVVESTVESSDQSPPSLPVLTETKPEEKVEVIACELFSVPETTVKVDSPEVPSVNDVHEVKETKDIIITETAVEKVEAEVVVGSSSETPTPETAPVVESKDAVVTETAAEKVDSEVVVGSSSEIPSTIVTTQETEVKENITETQSQNDAPDVPEPVVETKDTVVTETAAEKVEAKVEVGSSSEIPAPEIAAKEDNTEAPSQNEAAPVVETKERVVTETAVETAQAEPIVESSPVVPAEANVNEASFDLDDALESVPKAGEPTKVDEEGTIEQKPNNTTNNSSKSTVKKEEETCGSFIMRDGKEVCSHCDQFIGNIKITVTYPAMYLHPDCLKCGECTKILGDFLYPMFEHNKLIYCSECYDNMYCL